MKNRRRNCIYHIENDRSKCKVQCNHCKKYFNPIEYNLRVPRKLKKKLKYEKIGSKGEIDYE